MNTVWIESLMHDGCGGVYLQRDIYREATDHEIETMKECELTEIDDKLHVLVTSEHLGYII